MNVIISAQCTGEGVGIIFVLDASNSFQTIFEAVKRFAAALMSGYVYYRDKFCSLILI
jgi:Mg-chelatase subunit ChlD